MDEPEKREPGEEVQPWPFAVSGLKQARADLLRQVAALDAERRTLLRQIDAMEVSLRVLDPTVDLPDEKALLRWRGPDPVEVNGLTRGVLKALRLAPEPISNAEITQAVIPDRGMDPEDRAYRAVVRQRAGVCLRKLRIRKVVRTVEGGRWPLWELVRAPVR